MKCDPTFRVDGLCASTSNTGKENQTAGLFPERKRSGDKTLKTRNDYKRSGTFSLLLLLLENKLNGL